ncbi:MAG: AbrB/MazE/SpoVT family DNA-binding domain-containing protein [Dehalococcoidia bacterium]
MRRSTAKLDGHGRVVIPAEFRRALGLHEGDEVTIQLDDGRLQILTRSEAIRRAQQLVARRTTGRRSLVEELAAERRSEASRE